MRMKSVHLDRKLSATARLPKRSTIVESPTGRSVHPSDLPQRQYEQGSPYLQQTNVNTPPVQGQTSYQSYSAQQYQNSPPSQQNTPRISKIPLDTLRPSLTRSNTNTEVMIIDESVPNSPSGGDEQTIPKRDDALTLAYIPQLMQVAQAREQQRLLPRQNSIPYIAELSAVELAIVKHCAVLALTRSPLKDHFDLDEILEMIEIKKSGFWNKLFKGDKDKKNIKKKGSFHLSTSYFLAIAEV
jgi:hypothetical protein